MKKGTVNQRLTNMDNSMDETMKFLANRVEELHKGKEKQELRIMRVVDLAIRMANYHALPFFKRLRTKRPR